MQTTLGFWVCVVRQTVMNNNKFTKSELSLRITRTSLTAGIFHFTLDTHVRQRCEYLPEEGAKMTLWVLGEYTLNGHFIRETCPPPR